MAKPNIDISLDGVGESARSAKTKRTSIDIPLDGEEPRRPVTDITMKELEFVNRHHEEYKELRRRAREQGGR